MTDRLLTVSQVAERLGVNKQYVYGLIESKALDVVRLGTHRYRITESAVSAWVQAQTQPAAALEA